MVWVWCRKLPVPITPHPELWLLAVLDSFGVDVVGPPDRAPSRLPRRVYPTAPAPVGHLCGDLAEVMRTIRRHTPVGHPDRKRSLDLCREIQHGIHQLRVNADPPEQLELSLGSGYDS